MFKIFPNLNLEIRSCKSGFPGNGLNCVVMEIYCASAAEQSVFSVTNECLEAFYFVSK